MAKSKIHFIGIGGIGVSSLAQYYLAKGWRVSGSDLGESDITKDLKKLGAKIFIGQRASNISKNLDRVIYSAAVKPGNPEYDQARKRGIELLSYAEALGELTRKYKTIAVSGAHGKSTTTALLSLVLVAAGLDPTVIVGTKLREFGGRNFRLGKSKYLIIEADEYNRSFLNYNPDVAIITNIDKEHLDTYGSLSEIIKTFAKYFSNIKNNGTLIVNKEDKNSLKALTQFNKAQLRDLSSRFTLKGSRATQKSRVATPISIIKYGQPKKKWPLKIFGSFNQLNTEAVWQAAKILGISRKVFEKVVGSFHGSWRRMEELAPKVRSLLTAGKEAPYLELNYYSDYAHHPTEIKATIGAFRQAFPKQKLVIVFQAHQAERLENLFSDFVKAFDLVDELILLPIYKVVGREDKRGNRGRKNAGDLFKAIQKRKKVKSVFYVSSFKDALKMRDQLTSKGVIVFMGAGNIDDEVRKYFKSKLLK